LHLPCPGRIRKRGGRNLRKPVNGYPNRNRRFFHILAGKKLKVNQVF